MLKYFVKRMIGCIVMIWIMSVVSFGIITAAPGDYVSNYIAVMMAAGRMVEQAEIDQLIMRHGLDQPVHIQYVTWITGIITRGDFGRSFSWNRPVADILMERLPLTLGIIIATIVVTWLVSVPIAVYSARNKYTPLDYLFNVLGFIGLSVPPFLLAMVTVYFLFNWFGFAITGLFSPGFDVAPWSFARVMNMLSRIWLPILILGANGMAALIRTIRANLLDELPKQYVTTARAKGLGEWKLLVRYPIRVAINPAISTIGWMLPAVFSAEVLTSMVLNLETIGPVFIQSVRASDVYLAASVLLVLAAITIFGTVVSDVLLAALDPRIRLGGAKK